MDTPGHTDFSGETERALNVLDAAVLVISAADVVQSHTRTLWRLLEERRLPVILFLNKTDLPHGETEVLLSSLRQELSDAILPFPDPDPEKLALCDETCLDIFLREGRIPERRIHSLAAERKVFPLFSGSALRNEGVDPCWISLPRLIPGPGLPPPSAPGFTKWPGIPRAPGWLSCASPAAP